MFAAFAAPAGGFAAAPGVQTASLTPSGDLFREPELPTILSRRDAARYRIIMGLQDEGRWVAADGEIAALEDPLLLGHVLAQRYLHRAYKTKFPELQDWLAHYADHPAAHAIHSLALRRRPAGGTVPAKPEGAPVALRGVVDDPADLRPPAHAAASEAVSDAKSAIRRLSRIEPEQAERRLQDADSRHLLADTDYDEARADVAEGYLFVGENQKALLLAATARTTAFRPLAHWDAGLAAWRLGRLGEARTHFEMLARMPGLSRWNLSAAAFWAARVHARSHRPDLVAYWLGLAAGNPRTFYGLLAHRMLGRDGSFNFEPEIFTDIDLNALTGIPAARRALALLQIDQTAAAELELRTLANGAPFTLFPALVALADRGNMPALSLQLSAMLSEVDGKRHDHALYPVPRWQPASGYTIDRALVFALIRQESQFLPDAQSTAGAVGLLQLMPATAQAMAARSGLKLARPNTGSALTDPSINLALGQQYLTELLGSEQIKGNLILLAAAYNSGPGAMLRWRARPEYRDDPLLFLESLPSRETRVFAQRVLANYWVYRLRLGQKTTDLDKLAAGLWPVYSALDAPPDEVLRHAAAR
ncbi:MAG TPA: lytic transglycosylase domain-containing protein [Stellaceae bacterium]|nr:lytic transglycosylase domain-containing protein [Stellaceae bacterium]